MDCEVCKSGRVYCRCYSCRQAAEPLSLCQACDSRLHGGLNDHLRGTLCSECESVDAFGYCASCEQYMCLDCSKLIHNKGARLRHVLDSAYLLSEGFVNFETLESRRFPPTENVSGAEKIEEAKGESLRIQKVEEEPPTRKGKGGQPSSQ